MLFRSFTRRQVVLIRLPYKPADIFRDFGNPNERERFAFCRNLNLSWVPDWTAGTLLLISLLPGVSLRISLSRPILPVASMSSP